jgi:predicted RNA binding protein YcfA (HicA-like mRNA interferase family)
MSKLPQIKGNRLVKALGKVGWYTDRSRGSHVILKHENRPGVKIVIPVHSRPIKFGVLNNILKDVELSIEELKELL